MKLFENGDRFGVLGNNMGVTNVLIIAKLNSDVNRQYKIEFKSVLPQGYETARRYITRLRSICFFSDCCLCLV
jgi:hypothetical protein